MPFNLIIAGGRDFDDYDLLETKTDILLADITEPINIVCGKAKGADELGEKYAIKRGYPVLSYPADWSKGRGAGHIRNEEMAKVGTALLAFWDQKSKGTANMIERATNHKLQIRIIHYTPKPKPEYKTPKGI